MSENLAGVTLLAFGNGSPDVLASLANSSGDTELMYSELIGAAAFVTGFVAGVIILIKPFKVVSQNYVRDVSFFLLAAFLIDYWIHSQQYTLVEGIATVMIYVAYLVYVVIEHLLMKQEIRKIKQLSLTELENGEDAEKILKELENLEEIAEIKIHHRRSSSIVDDAEILRFFRRRFSGEANANLFKTFVKALNPFDEKDWLDAGWVGKALMILKVNNVRLMSFTKIRLTCFFISGSRRTFPPPLNPNCRL